MTQQIRLEHVERSALRLARILMEWDEPIPDFSSRFPGKLESCLATPFQTFGGTDLYPDLNAKAAILFFLLIKNHPFANGNKRIAVTSLLVFLGLNEQWLKVDPIALYNFAKFVASSQGSKENTLSKIRTYIETYRIPLGQNTF